MALIGYMGSGKTTVGRILSRRLQWSFTDLDREVSLDARRTIPEIFAESGEQSFREMEYRALANALGDGKVVACGGGVVTYPPSRELLRETQTVFLEEDVAILYDRTREPGRPLQGATRRDFERRYADRLPLYRAVSDLTVQVAARPADVVAEEILRWCASW